MEHLSLVRPIEASLGPRYQCPMCGLKLWTIQAPWTGWPAIEVTGDTYDFLYNSLIEKATNEQKGR
jgi:hypothetical protein